MANQTTSLAATKFGYVRYDSPDTHYSINSADWYDLGWTNDGNGTAAMYIGFADIPSSLKRYALVNMALTVQAKTGTPLTDRRNFNGINAFPTEDDFNASTIKWNYKPRIKPYKILSSPDISGDSAAANVTCTLDNRSTEADVHDWFSDSARCFALYAAQSVVGSLRFAPISAKSVLVNGSSAPYVTITYNDAITVTSKVQMVDAPSTVNPVASKTFKWELVNGTNYRCVNEVWTQASAVFYWRVSGASSYNAVNISGSSTQVTIPAKTFPSGKTIQYYVKATDTDGTTTQTAAATFTTPASTITPSSYPSGSSVDSRAATSFSWYFSSTAGSYPQQSATLQWRVSGASSWNSISASGTTTNVTVPGYTFPSGTTIEWRVTGADYSGATSTSSTRRFTTLPLILTVTAYPSGNNVDSRTAKTVTWTLENSVGAATQASAVFHWRVEGENSFHNISVSGNTKTLSVPAYTFTPGSTIEWYLTSTGKDGKVVETETASFKTQAFVLTITTKPSGSNIDTRAQIQFDWTLANSTGAVTQTSAKLYWRVQGASTYNQVSVTGSTKSLKVPANTFPTASTIQWYLAVTATGGSVTSSSTATFSTVSPSITATTYPSGSSVGTQNAITFKWKFASAVGDYTQQSAKLYWRVGTTGSYTAVSASGSTQQVTVPAYTFPVGSTIQWYLEGTDAGGHTSTTSATTFTTVTPQITATSVPSGSSVDTRSAITIKWKFASAAGDYPQQSATFYWRVSGSGNYTAVAASGTTAQVSIPAYTFPTASTIQWYLSGTDKSGHTSSTSPATFTTVTPTIKATNYPSGSNVDTRNEITFAWAFQSAAGDYPQTSATLYWRVSGAQNYTAVAASGSTTSVTIPANTFPTASTIQWYVAGTDRSGHSSQTTATTFTTVTPKITATSYPSGNSVYTAAGITFKWKFDSAVGEYNQTSAKLLWRTSTANPYQTINASGSTKQLTVPANTFPTNSTIYWYLSGTDVGGHTSTTTVQTFKTVSTQITVQNSPTSGYSDPRYAITFQWYFASSGGAVPQGSATFYWKRSTDVNYTSVAASGATTKVTIAANTFPVASTIDWYVSGTDVGGTSSTSPVYSFSTAAGTAYAYPQSPIGTAEDGSKPITFRWSLVNTDGSSPSKVTLSAKRPTDVNWTILKQSTTPFSSYAAPAGTFQTGEVEWKVVATNRDNIDGPAGTAAFVCLRAPDPPSGLRGTSVPITTVSWQADGQEAFEIYIDGEAVHQAFGPDTTSWTVPQPLEDGIHVITVRIQGAYGLWSEPSSTTVDILNSVPEGWEDFALTGRFDVDALLTAAGAEDAASKPVQWYRDGKRIARTSGRTHTDRYVLGRHSYYAEIWDTDGNYVRSNTVEGSMKSCVTRIAPLAGGEWLELKLSEYSDSTQQFQYSRSVNERHVLGSRLPVLELSDFEDGSGSYDCAFKDVESAMELEALRGQVVILKSRGGNVVIGALAKITKTNRDFYISYSFTVQKTAWEDFYDGGGA